MSEEVAQLAADSDVMDDDDDILVVDAGAMEDTRTFPERVFDFVTMEDHEDHDVVLWEENGDRFAMARESVRLPDILEKHFGEISQREFEQRLFNYGWEIEESSYAPAYFLAYRKAGFRKGMKRSYLKDIRRKRKSSDRMRIANADTQGPGESVAGQPASREGSESTNDGDNTKQVRSVARAAPEEEESDMTSQPQPEKTKRKRSTPHNPQDGIFDDTRESSEEEGDVNDAPERNPHENRHEEPQQQHDGGGDNEHVPQEQDVIEIIDDDDDSVIAIENDDSDSDVEFVMTLQQPTSTQQPKTEQSDEDSSQMNIDSSEQAEHISVTREPSPTAVHPSSGSTPRPSIAEGTFAEEGSSSGAAGKVPPVAPQANAPAGSSSASRPTSDAACATMPVPETSVTVPPVARKLAPPQRKPTGSSMKPSPRSQPPEDSERAARVELSRPQTPAKKSREALAADTAKEKSITACPSGDSKPAASRSENAETGNACLSKGSRGKRSSGDPVDKERPSQVTTADSNSSTVAREHADSPRTLFGIKPNDIPIDRAAGPDPDEEEVRVPVVQPTKAPGTSAASSNSTAATADTANAETARETSIAEADNPRRELQANHSESKSKSMTAAATLAIAGRDSYKRSKPVINLKQMKAGELIQLVKRTWKEAKHASKSTNHELVKKALLEKRNKVIHAASGRKSKQTKPHVFGERLISTKNSSNKSKTKRNACLTVNQSGKRERLPSCRLDGADAPQPRHNAPISLIRNQYIPDEEELGFVPYFDVDDKKVEDAITENFQTGKREKRMLRGAVYEEERSAEDLDFTLEKLCAEFCPGDSDCGFEITFLDSVRPRIARAVVQETGVTADWVDERFELLKRKVSPDTDEEIDVVLSPEDTKWREYGRLVDTYRTQFCSRCFTYCCSFHGNGDEVKPTMQLQYEKGTQRMEDGYWKSIDFARRPSKDSRVQSVEIAPRDKVERYRMADSAESDTGLSQGQEALCQRMFSIFGGDVKRIAAAVRAPARVVSDFVLSKKMELPQRIHIQKRKTSTVTRKKQQKYTSMKNYNQKWLARINSTFDHPWCKPCSHSGLCSDSSCSCVQNAFFCTKACAHSEYSPNFFRGCECKGDCAQSYCSCFAANRECDPDLCKTCGACTDPPNTHERVKQKCLNDNMTMRRHRRLLVGESTVEGAGFGLFTKDGLKKGDYVHEYVGELISQEEAERRGNLYDLKRSSYLFNQSTQFAVDATLKGNKPRFGNHSDSPNVQVKRMFVNGNVRLAFFAKRDIQAQSELFINYDTTFTNKHKKTLN